MEPLYRKGFGKSEGMDVQRVMEPYGTEGGIEGMYLGSDGVCKLCAEGNAKGSSGV